jgi:hypothetical protein
VFQFDLGSGSSFLSLNEANRPSDYATSGTVGAGVSNAESRLYNSDCAQLFNLPAGVTFASLPTWSLSRTRSKMIQIMQPSALESAWTALNLILPSESQELSWRSHAFKWVRIHRSTLLNVDAVKELRTWFGGKLLVKLKDGQTALQVSRKRAAEVRSKLGV